ncbi:hypothetical protein DdX_21809 [Ditylenchus destructor]|uniref:Uncharacterized protein n=1 Tax=Ditylenchus destructor TaxID=166010 RepID=A0AAD4QSU7_9BILA|nr:hypothetical protein DdX_21809 [Ditylenchus destructor]
MRNGHAGTTRQCFACGRCRARRQVPLAIARQLRPPHRARRHPPYTCASRTPLERTTKSPRAGTHCGRDPPEPPRRSRRRSAGRELPPYTLEPEWRSEGQGGARRTDRHRYSPGRLAAATDYSTGGQLPRMRLCSTDRRPTRFASARRPRETDLLPLAEGRNHVTNSFTHHGFDEPRRSAAEVPEGRASALTTFAKPIATKPGQASAREAYFEIYRSIA